MPGVPESKLESWNMSGDHSPLFSEYLKLSNTAGWHDLLSTDAVSISSKDALIVVDMQNDFLPIDDDNPMGGAFGVAEGGHIAGLIVQLMEHFAAAGATVVATRDYHPVDHCSFIPHGGPFPPHCVQGHVGSHFYKPIGECITKLRSLGRNAEIVFKGFHEDIDSFGSFQYPDHKDSFERVSNRPHAPCGLHGCSTLAVWTGAVKLKCSNCDEDLNAPPDVLSCHRRKTLADLLKEHNVERIFACGLAMDYCVLDTCINSIHAGFKQATLIMDAARAAYLPGIGQHGSGFLQDPVDLRKKMLAAGVRIMPSCACLPDMAVHHPLSFQELSSEIFPEQLGPYALITSPRLRLTIDVKAATYLALAPEAEIQDLRLYNVEPSGKIGPFAPITLDHASRAALEIPESAKNFAWGYPPNTGNFDEKARGYFSITTPAAAFFVFGGFIYTDDKGQVVAVMALSLGSGLQFKPAVKWRAKYSACLESRWQPVPVPLMKKKGAKLYAWVNPGEVLTSSDNESWTNAKHGSFVYLFHDNPLEEDDRDVYFQVFDKREVMKTTLGRMSRIMPTLPALGQAEPSPELSPVVRFAGAEAEPEAETSPQAISEEKPAKCCVIS
uniref:nicotinamidase n=1 Tax=Alexandrium catenella TaxID=2925 RepID=A0A7S1SC43_ALECA